MTAHNQLHSEESEIARLKDIPSSSLVKLFTRLAQKLFSPSKSIEVAEDPGAVASLPPRKSSADGDPTAEAELVEIPASAIVHGIIPPPVIATITPAKKPSQRPPKKPYPNIEAMAAGVLAEAWAAKYPDKSLKEIQKLVNDEWKSRKASGEAYPAQREREQAIAVNKALLMSKFGKTPKEADEIINRALQGDFSEEYKKVYDIITENEKELVKNEALREKEKRREKHRLKVLRGSSDITSNLFAKQSQQEDEENDEIDPTTGVSVNFLRRL